MPHALPPLCAVALVAYALAPKVAALLAALAAPLPLP